VYYKINSVVDFPDKIAEQLVSPQADASPEGIEYCMTELGEKRQSHERRREEVLKPFNRGNFSGRFGNET